MIAAITVVLALCLAASHAEAAGAWALWVGKATFHRGAPDLDDINWAIDGAVETRGDCEAMLQRNVAAMLNQKTEGFSVRAHRDEGLTTRHIVETRSDDGKVHIVYNLICLPDTIDPRGPKGGGR